MAEIKFLYYLKNVVSCAHIQLWRSLAARVYVNKEIISEEKLVPDVQLRDTNNREILSPLGSIDCKHILKSCGLWPQLDMAGKTAVRLLCYVENVVSCAYIKL